MQAARQRFGAPGPPPEDNPISRPAPNEQLQAELTNRHAAGPAAQFDLQGNKLEIRDLTLSGVHVEELSAEMDQEIPPELLAEPARLLSRGPVRIRRVRLGIPALVANEAVRTGGAAVLAREGLKEVSFAFEPGCLVQVKGVLHKLASVPFTLRGRLELTADQTFRFTPERVKVMGLPVPRLALTIAQALAGEALKRLDLQQDEEALVLDLKTLLPPGVEVRLTHLGTQGNRLVLEGGLG